MIFCRRELELKEPESYSLLAGVMIFCRRELELLEPWTLPVSSKLPLRTCWVELEVTVDCCCWKLLLLDKDSNCCCCWISSLCLDAVPDVADVAKLEKPF